MMPLLPSEISKKRNVKKTKKVTILFLQEPMQLSFKPCMDLEEYSEFSHRAIAVEDVVKTKTLTRCNELAGSDLQDGGVPSEH